MTDGIVPPLKRCTKCGEEYPATTDHFYKKVRGKYGLYAQCKKCHVAKTTTNAQVWNAAHPEKLRENQKRSRARHLEERRERERNYYAANAEKIIRRVQAYSAQHPESQREYRRQYYVQNRERRKEYSRRYRQHNTQDPEKARERQRRRRALKASLPATFTVKHERLALDYFNGCCAVCGRQLKDLFGTHTAALDHWIPLSKGGGTTPENMLPLCHGVGGCNNSKRNELPKDWLTAQFGKRKTAEIIARIEAYFEYIKSLAVQS